MFLKQNQDRYKLRVKAGTREQHSNGDGVMGDTHVHMKNYKSYDYMVWVNSMVKGFHAFQQ